MLDCQPAILRERSRPDGEAAMLRATTTLLTARRSHPLEHACGCDGIHSFAS